MLNQFTRLCSISALVLAFGVVPLTAQVTVLNGAGFQAAVAPGSFAALFGTKLAAATAIGSPGPDGRYPTQLGGLTVTVGGKSADLVAVSSTQINFVVPFVAQYGAINVEVSNGVTTIAAGSITIAPAAPGVFTATGDGKGLGAILNGFDFTATPFTLSTQGKTTIMAVYGTGFRFAGGAAVTMSSGDVSSYVTATAFDSTGKTWTLPVLYAGPVSGYEGLDQINVALDPNMNTAADVTLKLTADGVPANTVSVLLRPETRLSIDAVTPTSASPGSFVTVTGTGLLDASRFQSSSREFGMFILADGTQIPAPLLSMAADSAEVLVPASAIDAQRDYYHGPAQLCIVVDTQRSCLPDEFTISSPLPTGMSVGAALMNFAQETVQQGLAGMPASIDPSIRAFVTAKTQEKLDRLQAQITAAINGVPETIQINDLDGNSIPVLMDLSAIQRVESILVPGQTGAPGTSPLLRHALEQLSRHAQVQSTDPCGQPGEACLESKKLASDALGEAEKAVSYTGIGTFVSAAAVGCLADIETGCLPGAAATVAVFGEFDTVLSVSDYTLLGSQILAELQPSYLKLIAVSPGSVTLTPTSPTATFEVQGTAVPKYETVPDAINGVAFDIAGKLVGEYLKTGSCTTCQKIITYCEKCGELFSGLVSKIVGFVAGILEKHLIDDLQLQLAGPQSIVAVLGSKSLSVDKSDAPAVLMSSAWLSTGTPSVTVVASTVSTQQSISFRADRGNLLVLDETAPPTTRMNVQLGGISPIITTDKSTYNVTDKMVVVGKGFAPNSAYLLQLDGGLLIAASFVTRPDGSFEQTATFPVGTSSGAHTIRASSSGGKQTASVSIQIQASVSLPGSFTLTAGAPVCDHSTPVGPAESLNWGPSSGFVSYELFRNGSSYAAGITGTTFYNNANLAAGQTYSYFVRAHNAAGNTDSNTVSVSIPSSICQSAATLASLSISPSSVAKGASATVSFTLSSPAPSGGATIVFTINNSGFPVPSTYTIPAGQSTGTMTVGSSTVIPATTTTTVTASYGGSAKTASITVTVSSLPSSFTLSAAAPVCDRSTQVGPAESLNWGPSSGAVSYELFRNGSSYATGITGTIFYNNTNLIAGQTFTYFVRAHNAVGTTDSNTVSVSIPSSICQSAATLSSLTVSPSSVAKGASATVSFALSAPAPSGGATVAFTTNNSGFPVPSTYTIQAGQTTGTMTVGSSTVITATTTTTVTASYGGSSKTASITVTVSSLPGSFTLSAAAPVCDQSAPAGPAESLSWGPSSGVVSYELFRNGSSYATGITGTTFYNNANLTAGQSYTYFVRAHNAAGNTDSNTVSVSIPSSICQAAATLASLSISPSSVAKGASATISFTLSAPAPSGGATVVFTTNNSGFPVPSTYTIQAGQTSGSMTVSSSTVITATTTTTVTASYGGTTKTASITVTVLSPPSASCYISPNPIVLGNGATVYASASGGTGGYLYNINGTSFQTVNSLAILPGDAGTVTANVSVKDSSGSSSQTTCAATVQGAAPSVSAAVWNSTPHNRVNFSGSVDGTKFVPNSTVWFCVNGSSTCYQQPGIVVLGLYVIQVNNVNLTTGNWQVEVRTPYGSARSSSFSVLP